MKHFLSFLSGLFSLCKEIFEKTKLLLADIFVLSIHKKNTTIYIKRCAYSVLISLGYGEVLLMFLVSAEALRMPFFQSSKHILIKHADSSFYFLLPCLAFLFFDRLCVIACSNQSHPGLACCSIPLCGHKEMWTP